MNAILIHPDVWRNSQLSIARFYGSIRINGALYLVDGKTDYLVREDFVKFVSDLGMPTVEKAAKRYSDQAKARKILQRLARIVKARRKAEKRQRKEVVEELFTQVKEETAKASEKVQRFVDSGYTTTR